MRTMKSVFIKASEKIRRLIENDIQSGVLLPGDSINESELESLHQVSKTPIREALIQLQSEGLITSLPRGGMIVAKMSLQQLLSLWELLAELEGAAAKLCCQRISSEELQALCAIHKESELLVQAQDATGWQVSNLKFHEAIYQATRNPYLRQEVLRIRTRTGYYRMHAFGALGHLEASFEQHTAIVNAVVCKDPELAAKAMNLHMRPATDASGLTNFIVKIPKESLAA
jgi:DNA-binding GntR family transcriptional regulator